MDKLISLETCRKYIEGHLSEGFQDGLEKFLGKKKWDRFPDQERKKASTQQCIFLQKEARPFDAR